MVESNESLTIDEIAEQFEDKYGYVDERPSTREASPKRVYVPDDAAK